MCEKLHHHFPAHKSKYFFKLFSFSVTTLYVVNYLQKQISPIHRLCSQKYCRKTCRYFLHPPSLGFVLTNKTDIQYFPSGTDSPWNWGESSLMLTKRRQSLSQKFTLKRGKNGTWFNVLRIGGKPRRENRASARSSGRFIWIIGHPVTVACRSVGNVRFPISWPRCFTFRIFHRAHCPLCTGATAEVKGLTAARAETFHPELTALLCMGYRAEEAKQPQCETTACCVTRWRNGGTTPF